MVNTKQNSAKFKAAKEKYGAKFKILTENDFPVIKDITDLVESGEIKLLKRYQKICNERKERKENTSQHEMALSKYVMG